MIYGHIEGRKSKNYWGQHSEETFLKEDLAIYCVQNKCSYPTILKKYMNSLPLRKKWWANHDIEKLIDVAEHLIHHPPKVWCEQKKVREGRFLTEWFIHHYGDKPKKVHGH